jgi:chaperonin GroEL (HSP60 family)
MGGILLTNDGNAYVSFVQRGYVDSKCVAGNAILREIEVAHPAAKSMIELSRTQDEECGDGTTSVIILGQSAF